MAKIKITQVRSKNDATVRQMANLAALGIRKMGHSIVVELNPVNKGMIEKVRHLVKIEEVKE